MLVSKSYSANYVNADSNFIIANIEDRKIDGIQYALLCVTENLICRGCPTKPSIILRDAYGLMDYQKKIHLLGNKEPFWDDIIKGNDYDNYYPAIVFFKELVPQYLPEYPFLQQLIIPEVLIEDTVQQSSRYFKNQSVDFYLPEADMVIEIDGEQHKRPKQAFLDNERDEYLTKRGVKVFRIPTNYINNDSDSLQAVFDEMRTYLSSFDDKWEEYFNSKKICSEKRKRNDLLQVIATIRLQIAVIELCRNGTLDINAPEWKLAIHTDEVEGYERLAILDFLAWYENLCVLTNTRFVMPAIDIVDHVRESIDTSDYVKIEMSLLSRRKPFRHSNDIVYIYSHPFQKPNYFKMAIANPIAYAIDDTENESTAGEKNLNKRRLALRFILKNLYGFDDFRLGQERIVINALKRHDTLGVLPTGSGKSLCYQMAVLLQPCISFCICPIKSLMIDQDQNLKKNGISRTAFISSDLSAAERDEAQKNFSAYKYWWVFLSPERFQDAEFRKYLHDMVTKNACKFGYAVVDEVHCLSEWGHGFRVSYLNLVKTIKRFCGNVSLIGLTATASYNALKNIRVEFGLGDKRDVISIPSFTREELTFKVIKCEQDVDNRFRDMHMRNINGEWIDFSNDKRSHLQQILFKFLQLYPDILNGYGDRDNSKTRCGIIFTPYLNGKYGCYDLAKDLRSSFGKDVRCYGGEMPYLWPNDNPDVSWENYKHKAQDDFKSNKYSLLTATKAFGMGIDKPNVRYTIHYGIPSSLEALYQEAGRAGRDKRKATCYILYTPEIREYAYRINEYLTDTTISAEEINGFATNKEYRKNGNDAFRQLFLLANGLIDADSECDYIKNNVLGHLQNNKKVRITVPEEVDLQDFQKYIYHLSIIGVIYDWTVEWRSHSLFVEFDDYERDLLFVVENYIQYYEPDYVLANDDVYINNVNNNDSVEKRILLALKIYLEWYTRTIIANRKQALQNVIDECEKYTDEKSEDFKHNMEAYFQLDDVADMLGKIADEPREFKEWFTVLNPTTIKKHTVRAIMMNLNRFLESYQHNVGLNYVSGLTYMLAGSFDSANGKARLERAFNVIKDFPPKDKAYILNESAKLFLELGDDNQKEIFSEFMIEKMDFDGADRILYKLINDNFSLYYFLNASIKKIVKSIGDE